jgi:glycosyltransferase involved in cell wall biosynthesis
MIAEVLASYFPGDTVPANKRASIQRADKIICISENTKRDLLHFYPEVEDRTVVTLLGFDPQVARDSVMVPPHPRPYLLYVGMRMNYKNFHGLIAAFAASKALRENFDVICVGSGPFSPHERERLEEAGVADRFFQHAADDLELQSFYQHAQVFVYPSLYEGFGIPPLEAMAADCPVVCLRASSLPEVCGDAAEYADGDDPDLLKAAIERVAFSAERASELRVLGRARLKLFSWRECARRTSEVYKSLV